MMSQLILATMSKILESDYRVRAANSGDRALQVAATEPRPDLILLDVMMPGKDGYAVMSMLRENAITLDMPVIFVTAMEAEGDEEKGLELGAVDYITKPINPAVLMARVRTHVTLKQARDFLNDKNAYLEAEVNRRMEENQRIQNVSIRALAHLAETRDPETGDHILRTQSYVAGAGAATAVSSTLQRHHHGSLYPVADQVGAAARHRQGGHPGPRAAQTGQTHGRRMGHHENARRTGRARDRARAERRGPAGGISESRHRNCALAPRTLGRQRLPGRPQG